MVKSYKDNQTGEIVNVVDIYENIAITDKKEKIDVRRLNDNRFYTEHINPENFFDSETTYNVFAEKINSIDLSNVPDDSNFSDTGVQIKMSGMDPNFIPSSNESAIVQYDPEDEKRELMEKYGVMPQNNKAVESQAQAFDKILNPEKTQTESQVQVNQNTQQEFNREYQPPVQQVQVEDPIITMFKNVKRKEEFSIVLKVDGMIPRLDFIEMMEDSYEISIIDFLAEEMTKKLLSDPNFIKEKIVDEIKNRVYPEEVKTETKKSTRKTATKKEEEVKSTIKSKKEEIKEAVKDKAPNPPKDRKIVEGENPPKPKSVEE